jgi:LacI family transcriptional regulator
MSRFTDGRGGHVDTTPGTTRTGRAGSRPSIKDVAVAAGVSVGTVSNVLNRPGTVSPVTLARVQAAIEELGFVRNESARQLRAGSSRAVGLVVIDAGNPFFADVARGVEDTVQDSGGVVLLGNSAGSPLRERRYLDLFEEQRVRGVLIAPCGDASIDLGGLQRLGIPVVFLDRYPDGAPFSSVTVDDVTGGRLAAEHLLEHGHRRLAFVAGPSSLRQVTERRAGVEAAVERAGDDVSLLVVSTPELTTDAGREAAEELVAMPTQSRPTAVVAGNDLVAIGMLQGLLRHGLRVPEDVAVVGYDDIEFAASAAVPLSSVRQPRAELGRTGARLLFEQVEAAAAGAPVPPRQVQFRPELVVRRSSDHDVGPAPQGAASSAGAGSDGRTTSRRRRP